MEYLNTGIKKLNELPSQIKQKTLLSLYPEYKNSIEEIDGIFQVEINNIIKFTGKSSFDLSVQQLNDTIDKLLSEYKSSLGSTNKQVDCHSSIKLLVDKKLSPIDSFKDVLISQQYPEFIPFASQQPYIQQDKQLQIQDIQEQDTCNLSSSWDGQHPFKDLISEVNRDYSQLQILSCNKEKIQQSIKYIEENKEQILQQNLLSPDQQLIQPIKDISAIDQFEIVQQISAGYKFAAQRGLLMASTYLYINTDKKLCDMYEVIKTDTILACDVEFSNQHSYLGNTSLLQITGTQGIDYIVDLLLITDYSYLRLLLSNPETLKILHGSYNDFYWLQRDFRVFIINVFDTAELALLNRQKAKLQTLLGSYNIHLNKDEQCSDWAHRPLSSEQLNYAREDSHWLIGLAFNMFSLITPPFRRRMIDLELTCARKRLQQFNNVIFGPILTASSAEYLQLSLELLWKDVYCRYLDTPIEKYESNQQYMQEVSQIQLDFVQKSLNEGQFNSNQFSSLLPAKCTVSLAPFDVQNALKMLNFPVSKPQIHIPKVLTEIQNQQNIQVQIVE